MNSFVCVGKICLLDFNSCFINVRGHEPVSYVCLETYSYINITCMHEFWYFGKDGHADTDRRTVFCGQFLADSFLRTVSCGQFFADSFLRTVFCGQFLADSFLRTVFCGQFFADSFLKRSLPT